MDSFRFKCISVAKTEIPKGVFIKAINNKGPVELFVYGKKTPVDKMVYMEVSGFYKNTKKDYLVVKSLDVINRFQKIRESFSKLSVAMSIIEIAYKTKTELPLLLKALNLLENVSHKTAFIWFMASFLIQNGIFDTNKFSQQELSIINFVLKSNNKSRLNIKDREFKALSGKLTKLVEDYADNLFDVVKIDGG